MDQLKERLAQVERERDAAIYDMRHVAPAELCEACETAQKPSDCETYEFNCDKCPKDCPCKDCHGDSKHFKWRGPCAENTKEDPT